MSREAPIFCEAGVMYCVPEPHHTIPPYMQVVFYQWRRIRSPDDRGERAVYLYNPLDIDRLLSHWNRQEDWKYWVD